MRFTFSSSKHSQATGFTLVEVLVIAPIVILAVSAFVALMVTMIGDVLQTRDQNLMTYEAQDALDRIEQDVRLNMQFLTSTGTLPSPQGSNNNFNGTSAFTNSSGNTLLLSAIATDENPQSPWRWPVYRANQPNPCGSLQAYNQVFQVTVIYFIKEGSLWRRSYVPNHNFNSPADSETVCAYYDEVWQKNSCSPGQTASRCQTVDTEVMKNVSSLNIRYFSTPGSTTPISASSAGSASTVEVTINGQKQTAGRDVTTSASLRATKLNASSGGG